MVANLQAQDNGYCKDWHSRSQILNQFAQNTAMKKCSFSGVLAFKYPVQKHPADEPVASPSLWCYHSSYPDDVKRMAVS